MTHRVVRSDGTGAGSSSRLPLKTYVLRSVMMGLGLAVVYSAWVTVVYIVHGPDASATRRSALGNVIVFYFVLGLVGGVTVGLMWKLCRYRFFAYITSLFVAGLLATGAMIIIEGTPGKWDVGGILGTPILAIAFGTIFGGKLRKAVLEGSLDWGSGEH